MLGHIEGFIGYCEARGVSPFLCFYFHPWEFHPMPEGEISLEGEGYVRPDPFIVKNCGPYAAEQLRILIRTLSGDGAVFLQAREAAAAL